MMRSLSVALQDSVSDSSAEGSSLWDVTLYCVVNSYQHFIQGQKCQ